MGLGAHYMWHRASDLRARRPLAPGGSAVMSRNGFTLIELLIVVVIIGLLATISIPKFSNTKEKVYVASMKYDLQSLGTAQHDSYPITDITRPHHTHQHSTRPRIY